MFPFYLTQESNDDVVFFEAFQEIFVNTLPNPPTTLLALSRRSPRE
jgi:hypothetical protein